MTQDEATLALSALDECETDFHSARLDVAKAVAERTAILAALERELADAKKAQATAFADAQTKGKAKVAEHAERHRKITAIHDELIGRLARVRDTLA